MGEQPNIEHGKWTMRPLPIVEEMIHAANTDDKLGAFQPQAKPVAFVVGKFHELVKTQPKSCWSKHNNPIQ